MPARRSPPEAASASATLVLEVEADSAVEARWFAAGVGLVEDGTFAAPGSPAAYQIIEQRADGTWDKASSPMRLAPALARLGKPKGNCWNDDPADA